MNGARRSRRKRVAVCRSAMRRPSVMRGVSTWWWPAWEYAEAGCRNRPASRPVAQDRQGVADVVAVRRFGVAEGVPCGAEQVVRAGRGGQDGGERRDLGEDRGHEQ